MAAGGATKSNPCNITQAGTKMNWEEGLPSEKTTQHPDGRRSFSECGPEHQSQTIDVCLWLYDAAGGTRGAVADGGIGYRSHGI